MDPYDPTSVLFTKIKSLDPENVSKIMGYLLIHDPDKRDLMRLAFGPETLLQSFVFKAKTDLGLLSSTLASTVTPPSPSPLNPISRPSTSGSTSAGNPLTHTSPGVIGDGFLDSSSSWSVNSPKSSPFLSYDNIRAGGSVLGPPKTGGSADDTGGAGDCLDEHRMNDYLSFLNDSSSKTEEVVDPSSHFGYSLNNGDAQLHRRSFSASDACSGSEEGGFDMGYKHCLYYSRGFCKNGDNCKFLHGGFGDNVDVNEGLLCSPGKLEYLYQQSHEDIMRLRASQQQRLAAAQFMAGVSQFPFGKGLNFLLHPQNDHRVPALMMCEEGYRHGAGRFARNDVLGMVLADRSNSASRQIYLTFPAESTFKDEDVSNYFSIFGPVQDVRIPYQQKRMFGFVTFHHPETVKHILARGNPHFICDSRVLVKPYKEKGKVPDKRQQHLQQQQMERGNFSPSSPLGIDAREPYEFHLGAKIACNNTPEMLLRRKLEEQADLQQAIELHRRRFMNLQLPELKREYIHHHQCSHSVGSPLYPSATANQNVLPSVRINQEGLEEACSDSSAATDPTITVTAKEQIQAEENSGRVNDNDCGNSQEGSFVHEKNEGGSLEHVLPDNLFPPMQSIKNHHTALVEVKENTTTSSTSSSSGKPITSDERVSP